MSELVKTVGVVVPVRGWAPYLAEALDSVLAEGPGQVVVVDDASPRPLVLHRDHAQRVTLVRRKRSGGPAAARNAGVARLAPDLELIAFCDADDAWEPGSLAPRVGALHADPTAVAAFGSARIVGPDGRPTGEVWPHPPAGRFADLAALYEHNPILTSSVVLRRSAFSGFDPGYPTAEDWELWLRLVRDGGVLLSVPEAVVRYRRHSDGLTGDVAGLARAQRRLHEAYASAVAPAVASRALAADRAAEAAGLLRDGQPERARELLEPGLRRSALSVPGLRSLIGRRDAYRRG